MKAVAIPFDAVWAKERCSLHGKRSSACPKTELSPFVGTSSIYGPTGEAGAAGQAVEVQEVARSFDGPCAMLAGNRYGAPQFAG